MVIIYLMLLLFPTIIYLYKKHQEQSRFFKRKGLKYYKEPGPFFGTLLNYFIGGKHDAESMEDFCKAHPDEPLLGYYNNNLIVQNAEYVERILIKDFSHFTDHGTAEFINKLQNPFDESLFTMDGQKWRAFRYKLSPLFTSGKLKNMFSSIQTYSTSLQEFIVNKGLKECELYDTAKIFSMHVIGSSIFGIETNVLKDPGSDYYRFGKMAFKPDRLDLLKFQVAHLLPGFIVKRFGWSLNKKEVIDYFSKIVRDTLEYRRKHNVHRNDVIQLLLQLKEKNKIEITSWDSNDDYLKSDEIISSNNDSYEVTDEVITVQAFTFLIGGFEGLALAMMYACFELTQHPDVQEKARSEILEQVKLHSGLNYDVIKNMTYLENVIKETNRLHPPLPSLMRECTKDYTFPNGYCVRKGEKLLIPSTVVHNNPHYYSKPQLFKPERFEETIIPGTYLPFGDGPRICLGMRFALLHVKMGIASILLNYKLKLNSKTVLPLKYEGPSSFLIPTNKLLFDLEVLANKHE